MASASSSSSAVAANYAHLDKRARGKPHSTTEVKAIFMEEFSSNKGTYYTTTLLPLSDVDIPYVMVKPKDTKSGYTKIEPLEAKHYHHPALHVLSLRRFSPSTFKFGNIVTLQGLYFDISHNTAENKRYLGIYVDKIIGKGGSAELCWKSLPMALRRVPEASVRVASVQQYHKQIVDIMGDNEYARELFQWPPRECVAFHLKQSFDPLVSDVGNEVIGRIMEMEDLGFVWTFEPYDKITKGRKSAQLCLMQQYKEDPTFLTVKVTQAAGAGQGVEHHIVCLKLYQHDLAELALCTSGKDQTFNLNIFAEYGPQLLKHLSGFYLGKITDKKQEDGGEDEGESGENAQDLSNIQNAISLYGELKIDVRTTIRGMGFRIPPGEVPKIVSTFMGGSLTLTVSRGMSTFKLANPEVFGNQHREVANLATVEGDITSLVNSPGDVEFYIVSSKVSVGDMADTLAKAGVDMFIMSLQNTTFSIFAMTTNGCSLNSIMSIEAASKRARVEE